MAIRLTESRLRQIVREEASKLSRRPSSLSKRRSLKEAKLTGIGGEPYSPESYADYFQGSGLKEGGWLVGDNGYSYVGDPRMAKAYDNYIRALEGLAPYMEKSYEDSEEGSGGEKQVLFIMNHQLSLYGEPQSPEGY